MTAKEVGGAIVEAINGREFDRLDTLLSSTFVDHVALPGYEPDAAGYRAGFEDWLTGFPDLQIVVERVIADDELVAIDHLLVGTNLGEFDGNQPSKRTISVRAVEIFRVLDGQAVEHWEVWDEVTFLRQMGLPMAPE